MLVSSVKRCISRHSDPAFISPKFSIFALLKYCTTQLSIGKDSSTDFALVESGMVSGVYLVEIIRRAQFCSDPVGSKHAHNHKLAPGGDSVEVRDIRLH